jgi:hypothetical protein
MRTVQGMSANLKEVVAPGLSIYSEGKARPSSEQTMAGYERASNAEATQMAIRLIRTYSVTEAKEAFESMKPRDLVSFEKKWEGHISNFIRVADISRPALLREIEVDHGREVAVLFLTFCIIAVLRVCKVIDLRELHFGILNPGASNRATTSGIYEFSRAMQKLNVPEWPVAAFRAARRAAEQ